MASWSLLDLFTGGTFTADEAADFYVKAWPWMGAITALEPEGS